MTGKWGWTIAILLAAVLTGLLVWRSSPVTLGNAALAPGMDDYSYSAMARGEAAIAPFRWRIGLPSAARLLSPDYQSSYQGLTYFALFGAAVAMFGLGRKLGRDDRWGFVAMGFLFAILPLSHTALNDFWLTDVAAMFLMLAIGAAHLYELWPLVVLLSLIAGTVRETVPVLATAFCWFVRPSRSALWSLIGLGAYLVIRLSNPASQGIRVLEIIQDRLHATPGSILNLYFIRPISLPLLGLLAVALILRWRVPRARVVALVPLALLVFAQLFLASDTDRLLMMFTPALILLLLESASSSGTPRRLLSVACLAAFGALAAVAHVPNVVWFAGTLAICVALIVADRKVAA